MNGKRRNHWRGRRKSSACRTVLMWLAMFGMCAEPFAVVKAGEDTGKSVELHNPVVVMNECDTVYFGSYWQEDTNGDGVADQNDEKMPIRWRILSRDGDDAYVIADQVLDAKPYNEERTDVTWETCSLRKWLNGEFYNNAFTAEEQGAVIEPLTQIFGGQMYTVGAAVGGGCVHLATLRIMRCWATLMGACFTVDTL